VPKRLPPDLAPIPAPCRRRARFDDGPSAASTASPTFADPSALSPARAPKLLRGARVMTVGWGGISLARRGRRRPKVVVVSRTPWADAAMLATRRGDLGFAR